MQLAQHLCNCITMLYRGPGQPIVQAAQWRVKRLHDAAHHILKRIAVAKGLQPAGVGREAVLAWLSAAFYACEARTDGGEKAVMNREYVSRGASDGFALGAAAVALAFVAPVLDKATSAPGEVMPRVAPERAEPLAFRLGNLLSGRKLAAPPEATAQPPSAAAAALAGSGAAQPQVDADGDAQMTDAARSPIATGADGAVDDEEAEEAADKGPMWVAAAKEFGEGAAVPAHFMTECYFLALRGMQVHIRFSNVCIVNKLKLVLALTGNLTLHHASRPSGLLTVVCRFLVLKSMYLPDA